MLELPWSLAIACGGFLFIFLMVCYIMCAYFTRRELSYSLSNEIEPNTLEPDTIEPTTVGDDDLFAPVEIRGKFEFWNKLATRTYIAIALLSGLVYITSKLPGAPPSPFWIYIIFQAYTFGGAFLLYKTWRTEEE